MASLECVVVGITWLPDGSARLVLDDHAHPDIPTWKPDKLLVANPPRNISILLDRYLWSADRENLYCGLVWIGCVGGAYCTLDSRGLRLVKRMKAGLQR